MKTKTLLIITILAFTTIFTGCKKYEEGPKFITLRSVKNRLTNGEWKLENLTIGGIDSTTYYNANGFTYDFTKVTTAESAANGGAGNLYNYSQTFTYGGVLNTASGYVFFSSGGNDIQMSLNTSYGGNSTYVPPIFGGSSYSNNSSSNGPIWVIKELTNKEFHMVTTLNGQLCSMKLSKS
jgi:hypothetical protein